MIHDENNHITPRGRLFILLNVNFKGKLQDCRSPDTGSALKHRAAGDMSMWRMQPE